MAQTKTTLRTIIAELVERTNSNARRLRTLEEMVDNLTSRVNILEESSLKERKRLDGEISNLNSLIEKIEERIAVIEKNITEMVKKMKGFVTTAKIKELEELIDIYNPLKSNFITKEEVERMLEERSE